MISSHIVKLFHVMLACSSGDIYLQFNDHIPIIFAGVERKHGYRLILGFRTALRAAYF